MKKTFREELAELCHDQWSGWLKHQFSKMEVINGSVALPSGSITRWARQMCVSYDNLTEPEKDSDRAEADKFILHLGTMVYLLELEVEEKDWDIAEKVGAAKFAKIVKRTMEEKIDQKTKD